MAIVQEVSGLDGSHEAPKTSQSFLHKISPLPGLVLTTVLSAVLLYGINRPPFTDNDFYNFVQDHRSTTQAILNLLTHLFCLWHLYVLDTVVNFSTRIRLLSQSHPTLAQLKLWKALAAHKLDGSLPFSFSLYLPMTVGLALAFLPGFLWTGALTPILVTDSVMIPITVPHYAPDPDGTSWNATWTPIAPHNVARTPWGTFSYTPAYDRGGSMINTAAGVIFDKDEGQTIPRSDKTGYTYNHRSYGVGASLGLVEIGNSYQHATNVQYQEVGYDASITCNYNASSQWVISGFSDNFQSSDPLIPNVYLAGGATPDQVLYWQLQYGAVDDSNVVSINAHPDLDSSGNGTVVIATGQGPYLSLNQSQCSVEFLPTLFNVSVDLSVYEINVTAAGHAQDMDPSAQINSTFTAWECQDLPTSLESLYFNSNNISGCNNYTAQGQPGLGNIATRALRQLNDLSTLDMSPHRSNLGEMFLSLIQNEILYYAEPNISITDFINNDPVAPAISRNITDVAYSLEQGLKSLLDDSLLAFASAQLILNFNTSHKTTNGTIAIGAVQVGTKGYIYALFVFNIVLFLIYIEEMFRTRFWDALPDFDHNDLKSVLIASYSEGMGLLDEVDGSPSPKSKPEWGAHSRSKDWNKFRVRLVKGSLQLMGD